LENFLFESAAGQGIWTLMFVFLLIYVLKNTEKREKRYQDIIATLTDKFDILKEVKDDVDYIKESIKGK